MTNTPENPKIKRSRANYVHVGAYNLAVDRVKKLEEKIKDMQYDRRMEPGRLRHMLGLSRREVEKLQQRNRVLKYELGQARQIIENQKGSIDKLIGGLTTASARLESMQALIDATRSGDVSADQPD